MCLPAIFCFKKESKANFVLANISQSVFHGTVILQASYVINEKMVYGQMCRIHWAEQRPLGFFIIRLLTWQYALNVLKEYRVCSMVQRRKPLFTEYLLGFIFLRTQVSKVANSDVSAVRELT